MFRHREDPAVITFANGAYIMTSLCMRAAVAVNRMHHRVMLPHCAKNYARLCACFLFRCAIDPREALGEAGLPLGFREIYSLRRIRLKSHEKRAVTK